MSRRRARLDRLARRSPGAAPVVDAETRAWAKSLGIHIEPDDVLRAQPDAYVPTDDEVADWAQAHGYDLGSA